MTNIYFLSYKSFAARKEREIDDKIYKKLARNLKRIPQHQLKKNRNHFTN